MKKVFQRLKRIVGIGLEVDVIRNTINQQQEYISNLNYEIGRLENQLTSIQAIDLNFVEMGKIIIMAHVGDRDYIKIMDIPPTMTFQEWKRTIAEIKTRYGAKAKYIDTPHGMSKDDFWFI